MILRGAGSIRHEILHDLDLAGQVRMVLVDRTVDNRDPDISARGDLMQLRQAPFVGGGLRKIERVVMGRRLALPLVGVAWFGPGNTRIERETGRHGFGRLVRGRHHHVAVHAEKRHGPFVHHGEAVRMGNSERHPPAGAAALSVAVISAIVRVRTKVLRRHPQHDENPSVWRHGLSRRMGANRFGHGQTRRRQDQRSHQRQAPGQAPHQRAVPASTGSARTTCGCRRNLASTLARSASRTWSR